MPINEKKHMERGKNISGDKRDGACQDGKPRGYFRPQKIQCWPDILSPLQGSGR